MTAPRIDVHSHYFGASILEELQRRGEECGTPVETDEDGRMFVIAPERPYGPITPAFHDMTLRTEFLSKHGIERQVLTPPPFLFFYWSTAKAAYALMEMENDSIMEAVDTDSDRFIGFATVMLQDVPASIRECERVKKGGLIGVEIGSNVHGRGLEEEKFWPFYEAAESLGTPVLIHPSNVAGADRMAEYHLRNLVGFPLDTTLAAAKLIFAGVLDRFPRLKICLGQAGGFLPYIIGRLDAGYEARAECRRNISEPPSSFLRRFYYDTIIHSADTLGFLIEAVGADRLMLGTDYPFDMGASGPIADVEAQRGLKPAERDRVFGATATEFLGLRQREKAHDLAKPSADERLFK